MAFDSNGNWYDGRCCPHSHTYVSENTFYKDTAFACNKKLKDGESIQGKLGHTGNEFFVQRDGSEYVANVRNYLTQSIGIGVSSKRVSALKKACKDAGINICKDWGKYYSSRSHTYKGGN